MFVCVCVRLANIIPTPVPADAALMNWQYRATARSHIYWRVEDMQWRWRRVVTQNIAAQLIQSKYVYRFFCCFNLYSYAGRASFSAKRETRARPHQTIMNQVTNIKEKKDNRYNKINSSRAQKKNDDDAT